MKKNKNLIICLVTLIVLSIGYALFSETISINGTATAKGTFDVVPTCSAVLESIDTTPEGVSGSISAPRGLYESQSCTVEGNSVTANVMYKAPGSMLYFKITLTNNGTIPAVLESIETGYNVSVDETPSNDAFVDSETGLIYYLENYNAGANDSMFIDQSTYDSLRLEPGESKNIYLLTSWFDCSPSFPFCTEQKEFPNGVTKPFTIKFNYSQIK